MKGLDAWIGVLIVLFSAYVSLEVQSAQVILMNIMEVLYMVGLGLDQSSCALVGRWLGKNDHKTALEFYNAFRILSPIVIGFVLILEWIFRVQSVEMFTNIKTTRELALSAVWLFMFNIGPDLYKGML